MKKGLLLLIGLLIVVCAHATVLPGTLYGSVPGNPYVNGTAMQGYELIANRSCKDMSCVQQNIRLIDSQIADLIARRLAFVKRGAALKNSAIVPNNVQQNPNIITQVTRQAQAQGYPPEIAQSVFQELDRQSQAFEDKYENQTPQPSPNSLGVPTHNVNNPVITPTITPGLGVTPTVTPGAPGQP
ncbi:MAG: chorismate mutase [Gammaproteobacteria bacterium]|nr:chorismate mutase [Gammaproteobacteria bacterium]